MVRLCHTDSRGDKIGRAGRTAGVSRSRNVRWFMLRCRMACILISLIAPPVAMAGHDQGVPLRGPMALSARLAVEVVSPSKSFATDFALNERPISEHGAWWHRGVRWTEVATQAHHAFGTQSGTDGYDDSYAYLMGFGPDQQAAATLWLNPTFKGDYREFELLLRWEDTALSARGYECNLAWNGAYAEIVRWNGPYGNFTYITRQRSFPAGVMPPRTGDTLKATIVGQVIHVYLDKHDGAGDRLIVSGRDPTYSDGNPGMGFFIQGRFSPAQFGFVSFTASSD